MLSLPVSTSQFQLRGDQEIAHRRRVFVEFTQILKSRLVSWSVVAQFSMADSGVINSGHEPNFVQSLLQCLFERRTLAEKLKVKELGPDQPDGLIYCE